LNKNTVLLKTKHLLVLLLAIGGFTLNAQAQVTDELLDTWQERFPGLPYYSYGSGLGLTTPDSTYQLNIRFRMQNRATYINHENRDDAVEAAVRRLRLRFDGFVGDPRFLYAIQLSFAPGDVGELQEGENINIIRDAVMFYRPGEKWNFAFGQTKLPGNRQRVNSSGALQLTDRSINNANFTIDRDFGVQAYYLNEQADRFSYNIKTAVSTGEGRNWTHDPNVHLAYTGRLELFPLGSFQRNGIHFEGDLVREPTPKVLLAATYHYNEQAQRQRGQTGDRLFEGRDLTSLFLDGMVKYNGWAFQTAWMMRHTDDPVTQNGMNISDERAVLTGSGMDFQLSYLFPADVELIGRYSFQNPDNEVSGFFPDREQFSIGLTRYIWEHSLKFQSEVTYDKQSLSGVSSNSWYLRFQIELGI
jgi:phosphate-selective porin OprO and OprP